MFTWSVLISGVMLKNLNYTGKAGFGRSLYAVKGENLVQLQGMELGIYFIWENNTSNVHRLFY